MRERVLFPLSCLIFLLCVMVVCAAEHTRFAPQHQFPVCAAAVADSARSVASFDEVSILSKQYAPSTLVHPSLSPFLIRHGTRTARHQQTAEAGMWEG